MQTTETQRTTPFMKIRAASRATGLSQYFLRQGCKNGTIPAPHSETLSIISAWGALMEAEKTPGIWVKVPKD